MYLSEGEPYTTLAAVELDVDGKTVEVCRNCGQLKEADEVYQLIYKITAARRGEISLDMAEGLTTADYEKLVLTLYYADGSAEEAAFRVENDEVIFRVKMSCTAIFTLK